MMLQNPCPYAFYDKIPRKETGDKERPIFMMAQPSPFTITLLFSEEYDGWKRQEIRAVL